jgi:hypothetical protein
MSGQAPEDVEVRGRGLILARVYRPGQAGTTAADLPTIVVREHGYSDDDI